MEIKNHIVRECHVPYKLIFKNEIYKITNISKKFVIRRFLVKTVDEKIDSIFIECPHPNAQPSTGEFCIPDSIRSLKLNEQSLNIIRLILCSFNLDDCYFTPWDEIEYEKQEVLVNGNERKNKTTNKKSKRRNSGGVRQSR